MKVGAWLSTFGTHTLMDNFMDPRVLRSFGVPDEDYFEDYVGCPMHKVKPFVTDPDSSGCDWTPTCKDPSNTEEERWPLVRSDCAAGIEIISETSGLQTFEDQTRVYMDRTGSWIPDLLCGLKHLGGREEKCVGPNSVVPEDSEVSLFGGFYDYIVRPDIGCGSAGSCSLVDLTTGEEMLLDASGEINPIDGRDYTITCDGVGKVDHSKFYYDGRVVDDHGGKGFYMGGNVDDEEPEKPVDYLISEGLKTIRFEGYIWTSDEPCFAIDLELTSAPLVGDENPVDDKEISLYNVAEGRQTKQSSNYVVGGESFRAVDGNKNGIYSEGSVTHTDDQDDPWWEVDLGQNYDLGRLVITNRLDSCCKDRLSKVNVFVSTTSMQGRTLTQLLDDSDISRDYKDSVGDSVSIEAPGYGRFVRVQLSGFGVLSLTEVEAFPFLPPISPDNIAAGKEAKQSSTDYGGAPSRAVDGNKNGSYGGGSVTHTRHESNPWWEVDLGEEYDLGRLVLTNRKDCCTDRLSKVNVFVSSTSMEGRTLGSLFDDQYITRVYKETIGESFSIEAPGYGRYVRVQLSGPGVLSLAEVEAFSFLGTFPPPTPLPALPIKYGDAVVLRLDVHIIDRYLSGGRSSGNVGVDTRDFRASDYEMSVFEHHYTWMLESTADYANDGKTGQPIMYGDTVFLRVMSNRWLSGGRSSGNKAVVATDYFMNSYEQNEASFTYRFTVRSTIGTGEFGVSSSNPDPMEGEIVSVGSPMVFQLSGGVENRWITGGRTSGNEVVETRDYYLNDYEQENHKAYTWRPMFPYQVELW